ncbi:hypothetical protein AB0L70_04210 [Kribbella sp. NPDC051952]
MKVLLITGAQQAELKGLVDRETISSGVLAEGIAAFTEKRPPKFDWS